MALPHVTRNVAQNTRPSSTFQESLGMRLGSVLAANGPLENVEVLKFSPRILPGPWSLELLLLLSTLFLSPGGGGRGGRVAGFWGGWGTGLGLLA